VKYFADDISNNIAQVLAFVISFLLKLGH